MAESPKVPEPNRNENDCPQLMENTPQESFQTSTPKFRLSATLNEVDTSVTAADSSGECLPLAQLSDFDINQLIGSCDLKSEEITSLMAEEPPSPSESDDTYGSCVSLSSETQANQTILTEDAVLTMSEIIGNTKLDESMQDWKESFSEQSEELSSCKEPLIPLEEESDSGYLIDMKRHLEFIKLNNEEKKSLENDLINLNESPDKILEPLPELTAVENVSILDISIESPLNQPALADESLVDIELECSTSQTDVMPALKNTDKNLMGIEGLKNQKAGANEDLADIMIQPLPNQTDMSNKSLLPIKTEITSVGINNESITVVKNVTRAHVELIRDILILNSVFQDTKELELLQTSAENAAASQKGSESLETELRAAAEMDSQKRKAARMIAEIGFPKVKISDKEKLAREENCIKHRRKKLASSAFTEDSAVSDPTKEGGDQLESAKVGEELKELVHGTDSEEFVDVVLHEEPAPETDSEGIVDVVLVKELVQGTSSEGYVDVVSRKEPDQGTGSERIVDVASVKEPVQETGCEGIVNVVSSKEPVQGTDSERYVDVVSVKEPVHGTESEEFVDVVLHEDSINLNNFEDTTLENNITAPVETTDSTDKGSSCKALTDLEMLKKTLKKRVTFADRKGDPGVEHIAVHQAEPPKTVETSQDIETSLRFLTESYPSHEDDEMLSESMSAILETPSLPRRRRGSPRVRGRAEDPQKLLEELKSLEELGTSSVTPIQSPEPTEPADTTTVYNPTTTDKPNNKFSKFFKSFKKKILS